jgi:hypothetical protein
MVSWRAEQWSLGSGQGRLSCGISRSEDGFSVDIFRGETCLDSVFYRTRADAERLTRQLKLQYADRHADA